MNQREWERRTKAQAARQRREAYKRLRPHMVEPIAPPSHVLMTVTFTAEQVQEMANQVLAKMSGYAFVKPSTSCTATSN